MGWSLSWTAVRGKSPEAVLAALGLRRTGQTGDLPDREHPYCWAQLGDGWVIVVSSLAGALGAAKARSGKGLLALRSWHDPQFMDESDEADAFLASLSAGCEAVCCFVEEHVMFSRAAGWKDGDLRWSVRHDGQEGDVDDLQIEGDAPPALDAIAAAARAEQQREGDDVDLVYEVPVNVARAITGYRHDETELAYERLEPAPGARPEAQRKPSLLARLFGRG